MTLLIAFFFSEVVIEMCCPLKMHLKARKEFPE